MLTDFGNALSHANVCSAGISFRLCQIAGCTEDNNINAFGLRFFLQC